MFYARSVFKFPTNMVVVCLLRSELAPSEFWKRGWREYSIGESCISRFRSFGALLYGPDWVNAVLLALSTLGLGRVSSSYDVGRTSALDFRQWIGHFNRGDGHGARGDDEKTGFG